jgi:hypothetical protein
VPQLQMAGGVAKGLTRPVSPFRRQACISPNLEYSQNLGYVSDLMPFTDVLAATPPVMPKSPINVVGIGSTC